MISCHWQMSPYSLNEVKCVARSIRSDEFPVIHHFSQPRGNRSKNRSFLEHFNKQKVLFGSTAQSVPLPIRIWQTLALLSGCLQRGGVGGASQDTDCWGKGAGVVLRTGMGSSYGRNRQWVHLPCSHWTAALFRLEPDRTSRSSRTSIRHQGDLLTRSSLPLARLWWQAGWKEEKTKWGWVHFQWLLENTFPPFLLSSKEIRNNCFNLP